MNSNVELRPMMKISEMVEYLKLKNIKFEKISEEEAEIYLRENNNYYNVIKFINSNIKTYIWNYVFLLNITCRCNTIFYRFYYRCYKYNN